MDLSTDFEQLSLADLKAKSPADLLQLAEELEIENASSMRKGDMMFAILKDMAEEGVEISGDGVLEVLQDGFGFLRSPEANYLAGPDDIYVSPNQIRQVLAAHRRHGRGRDPGAEGGRAVFRPGEGQPDQLRGSGEGQAQGPFRQPDAALPRRAADARDRRSDDQGPHGAGDRPGGADRQGAARPDRGAAADRQDGDPAEHRRLDRGQPPRVLPDRAPGRRAAGGGHRHAALGEGRGGGLDLRRAGDAARGGGRDGDREGQAPGRAQARRGDPARIRSRGWGAPTTRWCRARARC